VLLQGDQAAGSMAKQFAIALLSRCLGLLVARSKPYTVQRNRQRDSSRDGWPAGPGKT
jgi:hypothetical protein